jgi:hypothetical protein
MVLLLISLFFSQLWLFTDEGMQEHVAYLKAFSEAILFHRVGGREKVRFKHSKHNIVALGT